MHAYIVLILYKKDLKVDKKWLLTFALNMTR